MAIDEAMTTSPLINFMIDLGHRLGLRVVAEGVETPHQKDMLVALGIDGIQGYWYSKPLGEEEALDFLRKQTI
jgi:EAL domain-containing protein (putative c-di-GMP-specific phosphodiesterase class I)